MNKPNASYAARFQLSLNINGSVDLRSEQARRDWGVKRYIAEWDANRTVYKMVEIEFEDGSNWGVELGVSEPNQQHYTLYSEFSTCSHALKGCGCG